MKWGRRLDDVAILVIRVVQVARVALIYLFDLRLHRDREAVVGIEATESRPVDHNATGDLHEEVSSCPVETDVDTHVMLDNLAIAL